MILATALSATLCGSLAQHVAATVSVRRGLSQAGAGSSVDATESAPPPVSTGDRINFDWSFDALVNPTVDAFRFKRETDSLLNAPLSQWEVPSDEEQVRARRALSFVLLRRSVSARAG